MTLPRRGNGGLPAFLAGSLLLGLAFAPVVPAVDTGTPDLNGDWQLNEELSDDPATEMRAAMREQGGPGGGHGGSKGGGMGGMGRGGGRGGMGGGGMGRGGDPGGARGQGRMERFQAMERAAAALAIAQGEAGITIRYADGRVRKLIPDGKKHRREGGRGDVETRARWKDGKRLVVQATTEQGRKTVESYSIDPESGRLFLKVEVKSDRGPSFGFTRVYDRVEEASAADGVGPERN